MEKMKPHCKKKLMNLSWPISSEHYKISVLQVVLLGAWASIVKYSGDLGVPDADEKANFFKGITIFCWLMVIFYMIIHIFRFTKLCSCGRESRLTLVVSYDSFKWLLFRYHRILIDWIPVNSWVQNLRESRWGSNFPPGSVILELINSSRCTVSLSSFGTFTSSAFLQSSNSSAPFRPLTVYRNLNIPFLWKLL